MNPLKTKSPLPALLRYGLMIMVLFGADVGLLNAADKTPALADTVVRMPLAGNVSMDDAVEAMKIRANNLNMKLVGELPLYKQLQAMGEKSRRIEIFQFCDPVTAKKMVAANLDFAAYLPCRISLIEDEKGKGWLVMMNLDPLINAGNLSADVKKDAIKVRDALTEIMRAGAKGEW